MRCLLLRYLRCKLLNVIGWRRLEVYVREVRSKENDMPPAPQILPPLKMLDVEKVLLSVSPVNPDGSPASVVPEWESSDPTQVGLEVAPDGLTAWALTPLENGAATITVKAAGFRTSMIDISYAPAVPGELNLSAGAPVPD